MSEAPAPAAAPAATDRDLRLDFFRGMALLFIFVDHIPGNAAGYLTVRNLGFSDATEIFVFISGFAATVAYGSVLARSGVLVASGRILHRVWQLYVAHIFLFVVFTAQIAYVAARFDNPMYAEEMNLAGFLEEPHVNLIQALLLRFRPANMDVLPLYIILLAGFVLVLPLLKRYPLPVLAAAGLLWAAAGHFNWNLSSYPEGKPWVFNPLCWQLLFVLGALLALRRDRPLDLGRWRPWLTGAALVYLLFAFFIVRTWQWPALEALVPNALARAMYPIDKPNLDILRLAHFLAAAYIVLLAVPREARFLRAPLARPIVWCGQSSLQVFCVGTFLAFTGHFYLVQIDGRLAAQIGVTAIGIGAMIALGALLAWFRNASRRHAATRVRGTDS